MGQSSAVRPRSDVIFTQTNMPPGLAQAVQNPQGRMQVSAWRKMPSTAASRRVQARSSLRRAAIGSLIGAIIAFTVPHSTCSLPTAYAALVDTALTGAVQAGVHFGSTAAPTTGVDGSRPCREIRSLATTPPVVPLDTDRSRMRCVGRAHDPQEGRVCLFTNIYYDGTSKRWLYFGSQIELDRLEPHPADPFLICSNG